MIFVDSIKQKKEKEPIVNKINPYLYGFLVSIDSFAAGIGIKYITNNVVLACFIFMIVSTTSTYVGFQLGKYLSNIKKKKIKHALIVILFTTIVYFLCKS